MQTAAKTQWRTHFAQPLWFDTADFGWKKHGGYLLFQELSDNEHEPIVAGENRKDGWMKWTMTWVSAKLLPYWMVSTPNKLDWDMLRNWLCCMLNNTRSSWSETELGTLKTALSNRAWSNPMSQMSRKNSFFGKLDVWLRPAGFIEASWKLNGWCCRHGGSLTSMASHLQRWSNPNGCISAPGGPRSKSLRSKRICWERFSGCSARNSWSLELFIFSLPKWLPLMEKSEC